MNIFHSGNKEIFIVKDPVLKTKTDEDDEEIEIEEVKQYKSKVDEIIENMFVVYPRGHTFSSDQEINSTLSNCMNDENSQMMKMSIGSDDNRLSIYIRGLSGRSRDTPFQKRSEIVHPKVSAKLMFPYLFEFLDVEDLFSLRIVCRSWKFYISKVWHSVFSREMLKHLVINECRKDTEKHSKIMEVRKPIV